MESTAKQRRLLGAEIAGFLNRPRAEVETLLEALGMSIESRVEKGPGRREWGYRVTGFGDPVKIGDTCIIPMGVELREITQAPYRDWSRDEPQATFYGAVIARFEKRDPDRLDCFDPGVPKVLRKEFQEWLASNFDEL